MLALACAFLSGTPFAGTGSAFAAPAREVVAPPSNAGTAPPAGAASSTPLSESNGTPGSAASGAAAIPPMNLSTLSPTQAHPVSLSWRLDKTGRLTPDEVLSPGQQSFFEPFVFSTMPRTAGTGWFRLSLAPYTGDNGAWYVDLNAVVSGQIPSDMRVWLQIEGQAPTVLSTETPGLYRLPETFGAATLFVRAAGLPAIGFAPEMRSAASISIFDLNGPDWVRILLAIALVVGLIRGIVEQREWRMWAALYAGALLVVDVWGFPATPDGRVRLLDLPGLLAPGVALLLLPHMGRHIMRSREQATLIDYQLIIIGLAGLALTLVPLISSHVWTIRYLPLWPLGMLLFAPTAFGALARRIPGAGRFLWISLLPPLGLVAFLPLPIAQTVQFATPESAGIWYSLLGLLPSLALAGSSVIIALAPTPKHVIKNKRGAAPAFPTRNAIPGTQPTGAMPLSLDAPSKPLTPPPLVLDDTARMTAPKVTESAMPLHNLERRMRGPLDVLLNEIGSLDQFKLPRELVDHVHRLSGAGRQLALLIGDISSGRHGTAEVMGGRPAPAREEKPEPFDLYEVILQAHNAVAEVAEAKNLALSWFTAPHLARSYIGEGNRLGRVLTLLAESAVHATDRGIVQIRVQRLPESNDPGQLLFTVSDTGKGAPPLQRSSISLVQVWELIGPCGGTLNVESGPTGTSIAFSLRLQALGAKNLGQEVQLARSGGEAGRDPALNPALRATLSAALRILVVSDVPGSRQLLSYYLDELPHEVREARSADEALAIYSQAPGALLIFDGDLPENDVVRTIAAIRAFEGEYNYPLASILALARDDEQMDRLRRAGCTHALLKPVRHTELRQLALRLAPLPKPRAPRPAPVAAAPAPAPVADVKPEKKQKKSSWFLPSLKSSSKTDPAADSHKSGMPTVSTATTPRSTDLNFPSGVGDVKPISRPLSQPTPTSQASRTSTGRQTTASPETVTQAAPKPSASAPSSAPLPPLSTRSASPSTMPEPITQEPQRSKPEPLAQPEAPAQSSPSPAGAPSLRSASERVLDDMLREAEGTHAAPKPQADLGVEHSERPVSDSVTPTAFPNRASETSLSAPYSPQERLGGEWVGEPRPLRTSSTAAEAVTSAMSASATARSATAPSAAIPNLSGKEHSAPVGTASRAVESDLSPRLTGDPETPKKKGWLTGISGLFQKKPSQTATSSYTPGSPEWVGEPRPISSRADNVGEPRPVASRVEYVGEPRPISRHEPEGVGEPRPISRPAPFAAPVPVTTFEPLPELQGTAVEDEIQASFAPLPDATVAPEPQVVPLAGLTRPLPEASEALPTPITTPCAPKEAVPLVVNDIEPEKPEVAESTDFDVPAEEMLVEVQAQPVASEAEINRDVTTTTGSTSGTTGSAPIADTFAGTSTEDATRATVPDPLAPIIIDDTVPAMPVPPAQTPEQEHEASTVPQPTPVAKPVRLVPRPTTPPVTRLFLPGMEPEAAVEPAEEDNGLRLVPFSSREEEEDIFTLTDVVPEAPEAPERFEAPRPSTSSGRLEITTPESAHAAPHTGLELVDFSRPAPQPGPRPASEVGFAPATAAFEPAPAAPASSPLEPRADTFESSVDSFESEADTFEPEADTPDSVLRMLDELETLSWMAREAFSTNDHTALASTAAELAQTAEALGLIDLIDLARCLEEEARANNDEAAASLISGIDDSVRRAKM